GRAQRGDERAVPVAEPWQQVGVVVGERADGGLFLLVTEHPDPRLPHVGCRPAMDIAEVPHQLTNRPLWTGRHRTVQARLLRRARECRALPLEDVDQLPKFHANTMPDGYDTTLGLIPVRWKYEPPSQPCAASERARATRPG